MKQLILSSLLLATFTANAQTPVFKSVDINTGATNSDPWIKGPLNGKMVMSAKTAATGNELYLSDGTQAGTVLLKEITAGATSTQYFNKGECFMN